MAIIIINNLESKAVIKVISSSNSSNRNKISSIKIKINSSSSNN